jgi:tRNA uridine 5-carboxymethylaminomethyl modification enzyme
MFTSRAEHRLSLRHDSCDRRLTEKGYSIGLVGEEQWQLFQKKSTAIEAIKELLKTRRVTGAESHIKPELATHAGQTFYQTLKDPTLNIEDLAKLEPEVVRDQPLEWVRMAELDVKYEGYIARQEHQVAKAERMDELEIPEGFDFDGLPGISTESRQKFKKILPRSVGQAGRISGVRTSDLAILMMAVSRR